LFTTDGDRLLTSSRSRSFIWFPFISKSVRGEFGPHCERARRARISLQRFIDSTRGFRAISALDGERGQVEERLDEVAPALRRFTERYLGACPVP
jgi:hypothetical protein